MHRTLVDSSLVGLPDVEGVSGIIPLYEQFSLSQLVNGYLPFVTSEHGITIQTGVRRQSFPDQRGNIEYCFEPKRSEIAIGGIVQEETAPRVLFFVAHGVGHAQQYSFPHRRAVLDELIRPASARTGSRTMDELILVDGEKVPFGHVFSSYEREASQVGWQSVEGYMRNCGMQTWVNEVRFWYSLFGCADHAYHRQSIAGPFPSAPAQWLGVFGEKFETLVQPYALTAFDKTPDVTSGLDFECAYAGRGGEFMWAKREMKSGLLLMRNAFYGGDFNPFPVHDRPFSNLPR